MPRTRNAALLFNEGPQGYPEPGKTTVYDPTRTIDLDSAPLYGGVLLKVQVVSVDPYQRGLMGTATTKAVYTFGDPIYNFGIARVLRSEHADFPVGAHVTGMINLEEYTLLPSDAVTQRNLQIITKTEETLPWSVYVGALGIPGLTAYAGYKEHAHAKKGETIFVSTGAGAVGSMVIQLAKRDGLKVIASAGSDEKVAWMKDLGVDIAFNYKTTGVLEVLEKEGPIDIYWDNVGGSTLDAALQHANLYARIISCGMISGYNESGEQKLTFKNLANLYTRSITISGFSVLHLGHKYRGEFDQTVPAQLASGLLRYREDVTEGLEGAGAALRKIQTGENVGKSVIVIGE